MYTGFSLKPICTEGGEKIWKGVKYVNLVVDVSQRGSMVMIGKNKFIRGPLGHNDVTPFEFRESEMGQIWVLNSS